MINHLNFAVQFIAFLISPRLLWRDIEDGISLFNANCASVRLYSIFEGRVIKTQNSIHYWDFDGNKWEYHHD